MMTLAADITTMEIEGARRAVVAAVIGTIIEWFDYALYSAAAGLVINKLFFPQLSATAGVLAALATFAVGFLSRPLGGIVISHFGDRFGRKPALIFTVVLMGGSTIGMGLLPTYEQIGVTATTLLVVLRLMQGFGAGAEYAGAVTLVAEYVPQHRKVFYTALLQAATVVGILLATLLFLAVSYLSEENLFSWGWRLPFLVSGLLFFVALYIRKHLDETPAYVAAMERNAANRQKGSLPVTELFRFSPREVIYGFLSLTGHNANAYLLSAFTVSYMINTLGMSRSDALLVSIIGTITGIIMTPLAGAVADKVGAAKIYIFGALFTLAFAFPLFALLDTKSVFWASLGMAAAYGLGFSGLASAQGAFLANLFPTRYRFSGIAVAREMNSVIIGGPTPLVAAALVAYGGGQPFWVVVFLMICCAITAISVALIRSRSYERMDD